MRTVVRFAIGVVAATVWIPLAGCGGGATSPVGGGNTIPPVIPTVTSLSPSLALGGTASLSLVVNGTNFSTSSVVQWNGSALVTGFTSATILSANVPASDLASAGVIEVTVENPGAGGGTSTPAKFTVAAAPPPTSVRTAGQIGEAKDILSDPPRGMLYLSIPATDAVYSNTIVRFEPVAASIAEATVTGQGPYLMSASSDDAHLWVGLDGDFAIERFSLPGVVPEFTVPAPVVRGAPQQIISIDSSGITPGTLAVVVGEWAISPPYNGVYIFDNDVQRPGNLPSWMAGGPPIAWARWGPDDSILYGGYDWNTGLIARLDVTSAGIAFGGSYGNSAPWRPVMDRKRNILYDNALGVAYDPPTGVVLGRFPLPGLNACTADGDLQRYYCATAYFDGSSNVLLYELWVYDLNTYQFIERVYFGWRSSSSGGGNAAFTGEPRKLVRWGKAGLALITNDTGLGFGPPGLFLFDGHAVNPNAAPDVGSGVIGAPCVGQTGACAQF